MNDAELERLRPPHVSMGAMKVWRLSRRLFWLPLLGFVACFVIPYSAPAPVWLVLGILFTMASLILACLFWLGVVAFVFLKYSLQSLMLGVLLTATIVSLLVALPDVWKVLPAGAAILWFAVLFLTIADRDPKRSERFNGPPVKPPKDEEDGSERVP
ncbi:MAG: hypothetical protein L6R28_11465 [Planctomycetes bacterium]|nr:hypothetical protein [Planctomycetota bacterium]